MAIPSASTTAVYPEINNVEYSEQTHQVRLTWSPVSGATNYAVGVFQAGRWRILAQTAGSVTSYTSPKNLKPGATYKVAVAAKVGGEWTTSESVKHAVTVTIK